MHVLNIVPIPYSEILASQPRVWGVEKPCYPSVFPPRVGL